MSTHLGPGARFGDVRRRVVRTVAVVLGVSLLSGGLVATSAQAVVPQLGSLTLNPASGSDISSVTLTTVSSGGATGCNKPNAGGLSARAIATGPGGWSTGLLIVGSTNVGVSTTADFSLDMSDTFLGIGQSNGAPITVGKYDIKIECVQSNVAVGYFTSSIWFTTSKLFQSTDPAGPTPTTTAVTANPASTAATGAAVTFTASVSPPSATGTAQFADTVGGVTTNLGSAVAVAGGQAQFVTSSLAVGAHSVKATYTPATAAYGGSASSGLGYTITAPATPTTTTLLATPASTATAGTSVGLTATVAPNAAGSVQFNDTVGGVTSPLGAPVVVVSGSASKSTTSLAVGAHSLTAVFVPTDPSAFAGSNSSPTAYSITAAAGSTPTSLSLGSTPSSQIVFGRTAVISATVSPSAAGTVQFTDTVSGTTLSLGAPVTVVAGVASISRSDFALGAHSLGATFAPTDPGSFAPSTASAVTLNVVAPPSLGTVLVAPATGSDISDVALTTVSSAIPAGCQPSGPGAISARASATGPGGWAAGLLVVGSTTAGVSTTADFTLNLGDTLLGFSQTYGAPITVGKYDLKVECVQSNVVVGYFTGSIWFTSPTAYQNTDPGTSVTVTTTALAVSPSDVADLGTPVSLTATIAPTNAVGTVQFVNVFGGGSTPLGPPGAVVAGHAVLTRANLPLGMYEFSAVFTPTNSAAFAPSNTDNATVTYVVRLPAAPSATSPPTVVGIARVGYRLFCNRGLWNGNPTSFAYSWLRNGAVIARATSPAYTAVGLDYARALTCRVVAKNAGGATTWSSTSYRVALGAAPRLRVSPVVLGSARVGNRLVAYQGRWSIAGIAVKYRWTRNGAFIRGATGKSYKLTRADKRRRIACLILTSKYGYASGRATTHSKRVR